MTRGSRIGLAIGAILVGALLIGLYVAVRGGDEPATKPPPPPSAILDAHLHDHVTVANNDARKAPDVVAPPPTTDASTAAPAPPPTDAGPRVHDHVGEDAIAPRSALSDDTRVVMRAAVTPFVQGCSSHLREVNPPIKARILLSARVRSAGGRLTAHDIAVDGAAELGPQFIDCVVQAVAAVDAETPNGQTDAEEMTRMVFIVP